MTTLPKKIVVLGATGFVGKNIYEFLKNSGDVEGTSRSKSEDLLYFDMVDETTWATLLKYFPDIVINCTGYGVVKYEKDIELLYEINYLKPAKLYHKLVSVNPSMCWIQIGTAFEYDLSIPSLTEQSPCLPKTHYGISKLMMSNYLLAKNNGGTVILRPFAMFGSHEDSSKIIPTLILSQAKKAYVELSDGMQARDYCYVKDLARFVQQIAEKVNTSVSFPQVINVGSGNPVTLRYLAERISSQMHDADLGLWQWGKLPKREGESEVFFNASTVASALGFVNTPFQIALDETIKYYLDVA